jgi:two-component system nitrate/nitrite response regulator NarL
MWEYVCGAMLETRLIIALPNRLLALSLAQYVVQWSKEVEVYGVAIDSKELYDLLEHLPAGKLAVVIYDPYLPGPGPQVICAHIRTLFPNLKIILMKNENANGRFSEAEKCSPNAIIGSDAQPEELLQMLMMAGSSKNKPVKAKPKKAKSHKRRKTKEEPVNGKAVLSPREQEMVGLIARGHSAKEIAFVLDISVNTARNHTQNILKKLKLNKKIQLISWHISK